jgi:flagellar protein FlaJ
MLVGTLPLVAVTVLCLPFVFAPVSDRARLLVSRAALPLFGHYVTNESPRRRAQIERMRAAFVAESHRTFAARTLLTAAAFGIAGSVYGVYLAAVVLRALAVEEAALRSTLPGPFGFLATVVDVPGLSVTQLFALLAFSSATLGAALAYGTYWGRWRYLDQRARVRGVEVDATLPRTVAFVYALSRSGMPFPQVLETLTRNRNVYGEAAREVGIAVRDMNAFGTDVLTALRGMAGRTPSDNLEEFAENLSSVLGSGRSLSAFLREQYDRFQEEAEAQQQQYLDLLSTFAEIYVTVLVAGPLFFVTVLVVVGLVLEDTIGLLRVVGYVGIPLATAAFVVYVDSMTETLRAPGRMDAEGTFETGGAQPTAAGDADRLPGPSVAGAEAAVDGGVHGQAANVERLAVYDRVATVRRVASDPVETALRRPVYTLFLTVPLGLLWAALSVDATAARAALAEVAAGPLVGTPSSEVMSLVAAVDGPVVEATFLGLVGVALAHEIRKRRLRAVESEMPDFLDRMASMNEAGVTVVESLERLADTDLGALGTELERTWRDVQWGADAQTALRRLERRTATPMVSRTVTLVTNAMAASGDVAPVLRIAADEAQATRRLRTERRQEMLTYLVVIYISFFVFLGIVAALTIAFIPAVEAASSSGVSGDSVRGVSTGVFSGLTDVDTAAYELLFFHVAAIQGVCSGVVAGQLGEGSVYDGLKHAAALLGVAYLLFAFL